MDLADISQPTSLYGSRTKSDHGGGFGKEATKK